MFAWPNKDAFLESATITIVEDLSSALEPFWWRAKGFFVPRGGTQIPVLAEEYKEAEKQTGQNIEWAVRGWKMEPGHGRQSIRQSETLIHGPASPAD